MKTNRGAKPRAKKAAVVAEPFVGQAYLYGIVAAVNPKQLAALRKTSGQGGLRIISHKKIAAIASEVHEAVARPDLKTHEAVLHDVAAVMTVLPARYGSVFADGQSVISGLLKPRHRALEALLKKLKDGVEVSLTVSFVQEEFLRAVVIAYPKLARQASANIVYKARTEAGETIGELLAEMKNREAAALLKVLKPFIRDLHKGALIGELMILNAIVLIDRAKAARFQKALAALDRKAGGRLRIHCSEPRLPYDFVDLTAG